MMVYKGSVIYIALHGLTTHVAFQVSGKGCAQKSELRHIIMADVNIATSPFEDDVTIVVSIWKVSSKSNHSLHRTLSTLLTLALRRRRFTYEPSSIYHLSPQRVLCGSVVERLTGNRRMWDSNPHR